MINLNATISDMRAWAAALMHVRQPDFVIGGDYLRRWWIVPRNEWRNVYLHEFRHSDDDRAMHDHPWANESLVIAGRYLEHTPEGTFLREQGAIVQRHAEALHRIELFPGERVITLFTTGPKRREWGFQCPKGWVNWQDFTAGENGERVGKGCGE